MLGSLCVVGGRTSLEVGSESLRTKAISDLHSVTLHAWYKIEPCFLSLQHAFTPPSMGSRLLVAQVTLFFYRLPSPWHFITVTNAGLSVIYHFHVMSVANLLPLKIHLVSKKMNVYRNPKGRGGNFQMLLPFQGMFVLFFSWERFSFYVV